MLLDLGINLNINDKKLNIIFMIQLFVRISTINLYEAAVDKGVVYAEPVGVDNLVNAGEAVYGCLAVYVLLYLLGLFLLPWGLDEPGYYGIHGGACALELLDKVLGKGVHGGLCDSVGQHHGVGHEAHLRAGEDYP